jgi:hypothetical protein
VPVRDRVCYTDGSRELASKTPARGGAQLAYHSGAQTLKPAPFTYHRPETLAEAVRLLAELAPQDSFGIAESDRWFESGSLRR